MKKRSVIVPDGSNLITQAQMHPDDQRAWDDWGAENDWNEEEAMRPPAIRDDLVDRAVAYIESETMEVFDMVGEKISEFESMEGVEFDLEESDAVMRKAVPKIFEYYRKMMEQYGSRNPGGA